MRLALVPLNRFLARAADHHRTAQRPELRQSVDEFEGLGCVLSEATARVVVTRGGLAALQTASITAGLPFAALLLSMCYTVYRGLDNEYEILQSDESAEWIERLEAEDQIIVPADDDTRSSEEGSDSAPGDD